MALALPLRSGSETPFCAARTRRAVAFVAGLAALALFAAPGAVHAASLAIDPTVRLCSPTSCDELTLQVILEIGENDADSFGFDISVSDAALIGLAIGSVPGNPIAGMNGTLDLLADGTTLRGQLNSLPSSFDGPLILDLGIVPLVASGTGVVEFRFLSAEIACTTCLGGAGQIFPNGNTANQLLATVNVVPEPGTAALLSLGLAALGVRSRARRGGVR